MNIQPLFSKRPSKTSVLPRSFEDLHKEVDRVFDDFTSGWNLPEFFNNRIGEEYIPSLEIHENGKKIVVSAELPGMDEKDIKVEVSNQMLTISGEKKSETKTEEGDYFRSERHYGSFSRSMSFPFDIDDKSVNAEFDKGVLTVAIKKPAEVQEKTKKIPVNGSNS